MPNKRQRELVCQNNPLFLTDMNDIPPPLPAAPAPLTQRPDLSVKLATYQDPGRAPIKSNAKFLLAHPAHFIALGFGAGLSPFAPGTAGTLWAWLAYLALQPWLTASQMGWLIGASAVVGWWACTVTAKNMAVADPGSIVWDEVVAFWLVLWLIMPTGFTGQLVAFALFRFFDAVKPGPVAWADKHFKGFNARGGFGILFDDIVAAFCTLLVIAAWTFWR